MHFAYEILKRNFPDLNNKELGMSEIERIKRRENIIVSTKEFPEPFNSIYIPRKNDSLIILQPDLKGVQRQYYLWYEIGRYFLHGARFLSEYFRWLRPSKDKLEAESLPLLAMMPITQIEKTVSDYGIASPFYRYLIERRLYLFNYWGI